MAGKKKEVVEQTVPSDPVPTFTLRADNGQHRMMVFLLAAYGMPASVVREFELYEEAHR